LIEETKTRNNPRGIWIALGLAIAAPSALFCAPISLGTVVDLAQRNSSAVKIAEADKKKAEASLTETKDVFIPSVMLGAGLPAVPSVGFSGGVPSIFSGTMQSLVFSLPQRQYILAARSGLKAASLNLKDAREQVALETSTAYIELDTVERELEVVHQQESYADRLVSVVQERSEAGIDPLSELLQAQLTAAELKLKRLHLETRAATLSKELSVLAGMPVGSIEPEHASIPEIPQVHADEHAKVLLGVKSADMLARSKQRAAKGDTEYAFLPQISFSAQYNRETKLLNNADSYYARPLKSDNLSTGFQVEIPLFDIGHKAKAKESAADALRATVEAEQAQRQNEIQIASLTGSLRELDALAEIATLKQQIAKEQLQSVLTQLEVGNGSGAGAGAQPQLTPKAEQLARIEERQKFQDALDAGFDLSKTRLGLLRALGHMEDWLQQLHGK
jgi:outer membrane protein TolC